MKSELVKGDSLKVLKKYEDNSVDLLCTDPPYGYGFMGRDWDKVLPDIGIFTGIQSYWKLLGTEKQK